MPNNIIFNNTASHSYCKDSDISNGYWGGFYWRCRNWTCYKWNYYCYFSSIQIFKIH